MRLVRRAPDVCLREPAAVGEAVCVFVTTTTVVKPLGCTALAEVGADWSFRAETLVADVAASALETGASEEALVAITVDDALELDTGVSMMSEEELSTDADSTSVEELVTVASATSEEVEDTSTTEDVTWLVD